MTAAAILVRADSEARIVPVGREWAALTAEGAVIRHRTWPTQREAAEHARIHLEALAEERHQDSTHGECPLCGYEEELIDVRDLTLAEDRACKGCRADIEDGIERRD